MHVSNKERQHVEIPGALFWQAEQHVGVRSASLKRGDAAVCGLKRGIAERVSKRFLRLTHTLQVCLEAIEKLDVASSRSADNMIEPV